MTVKLTNIEKSPEALEWEGKLLRHHVEEWVTEYFGERCPAFSPGCECCKRWAALEALFEEV